MTSWTLTAEDRAALTECAAIGFDLYLAPPSYCADQAATAQLLADYGKDYVTGFARIYIGERASTLTHRTQSRLLNLRPHRYGDCPGNVFVAFASPVRMPGSAIDAVTRLSKECFCCDRCLIVDMRGATLAKPYEKELGICDKICGERQGLYAITYHRLDAGDEASAVRRAIDARLYFARQQLEDYHSGRLVEVVNAPYTWSTIRVRRVGKDDLDAGPRRLRGTVDRATPEIPRFLYCTSSPPSSTLE
jgi:hypothetical protein